MDENVILDAHLHFTKSNHHMIIEQVRDHESKGGFIRSRHQPPEPEQPPTIQPPRRWQPATAKEPPATAPPLATFPTEWFSLLTLRFSFSLIFLPAASKPSAKQPGLDGQGSLCQWLGWLGWLDGFGCGCFGALASWLYQVGRARSFLCAAPSSPRTGLGPGATRQLSIAHTKCESVL